MFDEVPEVDQFEDGISPLALQQLKSTARLGVGPDGSGVGVHSGAGAMLRPLTGGAVVVCLWPTNESHPLDTRPISTSIEQLQEEGSTGGATVLLLQPSEQLLVPEGWGVGWAVRGADSTMLVHQLKEGQPGGLGKLLQAAEADAGGAGSLLQPDARMNKLIQALSSKLKETAELEEELNELKDSADRALESVESDGPATAGLHPVLAQAYGTMAKMLVDKAKKQEEDAMRQASLNRAASIALAAQGLEPTSARIAGEAADVFFQVYQLAENISHVSSISALEQAIRSYSDALAIAPKSAEMHQNLGASLLALATEKDDLPTAQRAMHHLSRLMQEERTWPPVASPSALAEQILQMAHSNTGSSFSKLLLASAESFVARAVQLQPEEPDGHTLQARVHMHNGEFGEAKKCVETAIELDKQAVESWLTLAELHGRVGQRSQAAAVLRDAAKHIKGDEESKAIEKMHQEYAD